MKAAPLLISSVADRNVCSAIGDVVMETIWSKVEDGGPTDAGGFISVVMVTWVGSTDEHAPAIYFASAGGGRLHPVVSDNRANSNPAEIWVPFYGASSIRHEIRCRAVTCPKCESGLSLSSPVATVLRPDGGSTAHSDSAGPARTSMAGWSDFVGPARGLAHGAN